MARQPSAKAAKSSSSSATAELAVLRKPRLTLPAAAARSTDVRTLVVNFTILAIIILIVPVVSVQFLRNQVLIEPIAVPQALQASGLTPEVAANRLWDGFKEIKEAAETAKGGVSTVPDSQKVDFSIPDSGLSIDSLIYYVRQFFHAYETRITGEFRCADPACAPEGVTLRLRIVREGLDLVELPPMGSENEARYFRDAAGEVLAVIDPFIALAAAAETDPDRAIVLARRLIRTNHPDAKWAHNLIGNQLVGKDDVPAAIDEFRAALTIDAGFIQALNNLGNALRIQGDLKGARDAFDAVVAKDKSNVFALNGYANIALAEGRPDEAIGFYLQAAKVRPLPPIFLARAASVEKALGHKDKAVGYLREALAVDPGDTLALSTLGIIYLSELNYEQAERLYRDAADYAPADASLQAAHSDMLIGIARYDEALSRADAAVELQPDNSAYGISRATALFYLQRHADAVAELKRVNDLRPDMPNVFYDLGKNYSQLGLRDDAIAAFNRFLELDPETVWRPVVEIWLTELAAPASTAKPSPVSQP